MQTTQTAKRNTKNITLYKPTFRIVRPFNAFSKTDKIQRNNNHMNAAYTCTERMSAVNASEIVQRNSVLKRAQKRHDTLRENQKYC